MIIDELFEELIKRDTSNISDIHKPNYENTDVKNLTRTFGKDSIFSYSINNSYNIVNKVYFDNSSKRFIVYEELSYNENTNKDSVLENNFKSLFDSSNKGKNKKDNKLKASVENKTVISSYSNDIDKLSYNIINDNLLTVRKNNTSFEINNKKQFFQSYNNSSCNSSFSAKTLNEGNKINNNYDNINEEGIFFSNYSISKSITHEMSSKLLFSSYYNFFNYYNSHIKVHHNDSLAVKLVHNSESSEELLLIMSVLNSYNDISLNSTSNNCILSLGKNKARKFGKENCNNNELYNQNNDITMSTLIKKITKVISLLSYSNTSNINNIKHNFLIREILSQDFVLSSYLLNQLKHEIYKNKSLYEDIRKIKDLNLIILLIVLLRISCITSFTNSLNYQTFLSVLKLIIRINNSTSTDASLSAKKINEFKKTKINIIMLNKLKEFSSLYPVKATLASGAISNNCFDINSFFSYINKFFSIGKYEFVDIIDKLRDKGYLIKVIGNNYKVC